MRYSSSIFPLYYWEEDKADLEGLVEIDDDPAGVAEEEEDDDHHEHARHRAVPPVRKIRASSDSGGRF